MGVNIDFAEWIKELNIEKERLDDKIIANRGESTVNRSIKAYHNRRKESIDERIKFLEKLIE